MSTHKLLVLLGSAVVAALPTSAHAIALDVGQLVKGQPVDFTVTGATPGTRVWVAAGSVAGNGPCPPALGGECLDIVNPILVGTAIADGGGNVILPRTVPGNVQVGDYVFQVVQGGAQPAASVPGTKPVLQILTNPLVVSDAPSLVEAIYSLEGDVTLAPGTYANLVSLPYFERGEITITRLDLDEVTLDAWLEGSLLVGPESLVPTDPAPGAAVRAPVLQRLVDLDAWAWDLDDLEFPALTEVAAIRFNVTGPPAEPANLRFPSLQAVTGASVRGLLGLDFTSLSGREVTVDLGIFDGLRFGGDNQRIGLVEGENTTDADLRLGGNVQVLGRALQRVPGTVILDGDGGHQPRIEAPVLAEAGSYERATGGILVEDTGYATLDGMLPSLRMIGRFDLLSNRSLAEVGRVGVDGMVVAVVEEHDNPSLTGWTPERSGWIADTFISDDGGGGEN